MGDWHEFFFSSRRRHTRWPRDWSSDVCSSDLGTLSLINPFLDEMKRTAKVRIDIPNPEFKLRPGMYVNAELAMDMGEALTVPVSAIMPTGDRNIVFIDKGEGKLEPRIVRLGSKYGDIYEVQSGLQEG